MRRLRWAGAHQSWEQVCRRLSVRTSSCLRSWSTVGPSQGSMSLTVCYSTGRGSARHPAREQRTTEPTSVLGLEW